MKYRTKIIQFQGRKWLHIQNMNSQILCIIWIEREPFQETTRNKKHFVKKSSWHLANSWYEIYHNGTGNSNESLLESVMKYRPKLAIHLGSNKHCSTHFTNAVKAILLNRSTCRLVLKKSASDLRYWHPNFSFKMEFHAIRLLLNPGNDNLSKTVSYLCR